MSESPAAISSRASQTGVAAVSGLIWVYQHTVSPALSVAAPMCGCRFAPTCSHYAQAALREHGLVHGLALAVRRLAKCGPWHPGGLDPVPPRKPSCLNVSRATPAEG
ncbi:MAG: membrane protein insertion efficiency factor YidD [Candidatus Didemnitutus sp.]|nr:membrane protein insertion efficiency factor YidD [Candidatus Didemnitutus sp.]